MVDGLTLGLEYGLLHELAMTTAAQKTEKCKLGLGVVFYVSPVAQDSWVFGDEQQVSLPFLGKDQPTR